MKNENLTISKPDRSQKSPSNYHWLRKAGLEHIEKLSGRLWTDYNTHDPGITILEVLSYALTDLSYRMSLPVMDLLAAEKDNGEKMKQHFAGALSVMPSRPLSVNDYRKLLVDISGVNNAWLTSDDPEVTLFFNKKTGLLSTDKPSKDPFEIKKVSGLYKVLVEFDEDLKAADKQGIWDEIRLRLHSNRNLAEDFVSFEEIKKQEFILCGEIDLEPGANVEKVEAEILFRVKNYLAPGVRSYSLKQLMEKGKTPEEIFDGPLHARRNVLFSNGFIDKDELERSGLKKEIRLSDLINIVMQVEGVRSARDLIIQPWMEKLPEDWNKWHVKVNSNHQPNLRIKESRLVHYKDMLPFRASADQVKDLFDAKIEAARLDEESRKVEDLPMPLGDYSDTGNYFSVNDEFPQNYGIGHAGLPESATLQRKARAEQLKGYILFFDQVLGNYFSQLSHLRDLFSNDENIPATRFSQVIKGIDGVEGLYKDFASLTNDLDLLAEDPSTFQRRRNEFLDHLLARFNEQFSEYAALIYSWEQENTAGADLVYDKCIFLKEQPQLSMHRSGALNYLDEQELWDTLNVSGLQHRVARLAGISNYSRRNLAKISYDVYEEKDDDDKTEYRFRIIDKENDKILISASTKYLERHKAEAEMREGVRLGMKDRFYERKITTDGRFYFNLVDESGEVVARRIEYFTTEQEREEAIRYLRRFLKERYGGEGMFVIEHLLLRPREKDHALLPVCVEDPSEDCPESDPYSHRVSVILPAWEERFSRMEFRHFLQNTIRLETPAHVYPKICWVNEEQMSAFEDAYHDFLEAQARYLLRPGKRNSARFRKALEEITDVLPQLKNVYPEGTLHDCVDGEDDHPVILGSTGVGSLKRKK